MVGISRDPAVGTPGDRQTGDGEPWRVAREGHLHCPNTGYITGHSQITGSLGGWQRESTFCAEAVDLSSEDIIVSGWVGVEGRVRQRGFPVLKLG